MNEIIVLGVMLIVISLEWLDGMFSKEEMSILFFIVLFD